MTAPDPTYDRKVIDANPEWDLAFTLSEIDNDNAPFGWASYIPVAKSLLNIYTIKRKPSQKAA